MQGPTKKKEIKNISINEIRNIDPTQMKYITLVDGSIIYINNTKSSKFQTHSSNKVKPLFTPYHEIPVQTQYSYTQPSQGVQKCKHCHRIKRPRTQQYNAQFNNSKTSQSFQNESIQNYEYYQQGNEQMNQTEGKKVLKSVGQQKLKNDKGQLLNDIITYKEQDNTNYYGGEQGQAQGQAEAEYYNNAGEGYDQQQNYNYYMEGNEGYYQQEQGYGQNQGYANQYEEINTDKPSVTVKEIITTDIKEDQKGENAEEEEENNKEKKEDEEEKEDKNIIENKEENQEERPLPELKDIIEQQEINQKKKEEEEVKENEQKEKVNEDEKKVENEEDEKKEGYYYVQKEEPFSQVEQKQEQDKEKEEKDNNEQNKEEFKETEYKGDEDEEAHAQENDDKNKKKEEIPEKNQPELEPELEPNSYFPRPRIPITRIEYVKYVFPKKTVNPFPINPFQLFLEEGARRNREQRSHSYSHTYNPTITLTKFPFASMGIPFLGPRNINIIDIPPRPPRMSPMPPMEILVQEDRPQTQTMPRDMRTEIHHLPHGPIPQHFPHGTIPQHFPHGPIPQHFPHGPIPQHFPHGPIPQHFPHGPIPQHFPHGPIPQHFPHGPIPQYFPHGPIPHRFGQDKGEHNYGFDEDRRFFERNEEEEFTHIHPHPYPYPYQRYVYPRPKRRIEDFYMDFEPEEMSVRSNYFFRRDQDSQTESDFDNGEDSYYSYTVTKPRRVINNRSTSLGRDGRFSFNLGLSQPRTMFTKVDNSRFKRTTGAAGNQRVNTLSSATYTQRSNKFDLNKGKRLFTNIK